MKTCLLKLIFLFTSSNNCKSVSVHQKNVPTILITEYPPSVITVFVLLFIMERFRALDYNSYFFLIVTD